MIRLHRRTVFFCLLALVAASVGAYFLLRPPPPPIPAVDLKNADPEVAAAITAAIDEVKASPRNAAVWGKLGMLLRAHDFDMASVEALRAAERFDPKDPRWPYYQGLTLVLYDPDAGLECLQRAAARAPDDRPEPRLRLAEALLDRGRVAEAEDTARPVVDRKPWDPRGCVVMTRAATDRGDWNAVLARSEPVRDEPAVRKRIAVYRANALRRLGRNAEADTELARVAGWPDDTGWDDKYVRDIQAMQVGGDVELQQGTALMASGHAEEAIAVLERAVLKSRNPTPARLLLGQALLRANNPAAALRVLSEVVKQDANSVEGWFQLGNAQYLLDDPKAAAESFGKAITIKPDHALSYFNLGLARKKFGDRTGAETAFEAALRCRPDHEPSRQALAELRAGK